MTFRSAVTRLARAVTLSIAVLGAYATAQPPGGSMYGDGRDKHWRIRSESRVSGEAVFAFGRQYRLITAGGQLAADLRARTPGVHLLHVGEGSENVGFRTRRADGLISLGEPVALYLFVGRAYVVHKRGPSYSLGLAHYEPAREPPMEEPEGIFQWVFRSPPGSTVRDHRRRQIVTLETLGLFNTSAGAYLAYDSRDRKLRWIRR